jgi:hypothetical protein
LLDEIGRYRRRFPGGFIKHAVDPDFVVNPHHRHAAIGVGGRFTCRLTRQERWGNQHE